MVLIQHCINNLILLCKSKISKTPLRFYLILGPLSLSRGVCSGSAKHSWDGCSIVDKVCHGEWRLCGCYGEYCFSIVQQLLLTEV